MAELTRAIDLIKEKGFITEVEVSSIYNSLFRKDLGKQLEKENINCYCFAEEYENEGWFYSYYNREFFPDDTEFENHSREHYLKERGYKFQGK